MMLRFDERQMPFHSATITVIIPTFNRPDLLAAAVDSVLIQSHPVNEIIIVDDGSDIEHRPALAALAQRIPQVQLYTLPDNMGRSRARNEGLARARGSYVLFLDDDDMLDPNMIESALTCFMNQAELDIVVCQAKFVGSHGGPPRLFDPFHLDGSAAPPPRWLAAWLRAMTCDHLDLQTNSTRALLLSCPAIHACLIRKDAIGGAQFAEDLACGEDWLFWVSLTIKKCRFHFNSNAWVYVRRHERNIHPAFPASAHIACERALGAVRSLGHVEEFLATARLARTYQLQQKAQWRSLAGWLGRSPILLAKYGTTFLAKKAYLIWRQWTERFGHRLSRQLRLVRPQPDATP